MDRAIRAAPTFSYFAQRVGACPDSVAEAYSDA